MARKHPPIQIGDRFGDWTVIGETIIEEKAGKKSWKCLARCDCGYESLIPKSNLTGGLTKSCRSCATRKIRKKEGKARVTAMAAGSIRNLANLFTTDQLESIHQTITDERTRRGIQASQTPQAPQPRSAPIQTAKYGRVLPDNLTDWSLFNELVRVHRSVITGSQGNTRDLYEWWARWNRIYFQESLKPLFIYTGNTDYGKYLGFCRYFPNREILIQQQGIKSLPIGRRHGVAKRHETFTDLSETHYCIALILLHEMIHQACFEAGVNPSHEGEPWAAHCNAIGMDLGLRLTFSATKRGKQPAAMGQTTRANVWKATSTTLLEGTDRLATHDECRSFPWRSDDPFIAANTMEVMKRDSIAPVQVLPKF